MSRHPSPGPSQLASHGPTFHANSRQKSNKVHTTGIAAGAEDAKYKAKYRELRKKVREIEADNDKLYFKTLQAKRNIQRMRIERAILYERLSAHIPASPRAPERHASHYHPVQHQQPAGHAPHHHRDYQEPAGAPLDPNDPAAEYHRNHGSFGRIAQTSDGHPILVAEPAPGIGMANSPHAVPLHSARQTITYPSSRDRHHSNLPPLPAVQHLEPPRAHGQRRSASQSGSPSTSSHSRSRSRGNYGSAHPSQASHMQAPAPGYAPHEQAHLETFPPSQRESQSAVHSSDRGRSRRSDVQELTHSPAHLSVPQPTHSSHGSRSPASEATHSPPLSRSSTRLHNHQRIGPGAHINNYGRHPERDQEREVRDREREAEWEREHDRERRVRDREENGAPMSAGAGASAPRGASPPAPVSRSRSMVEGYPGDRERGAGRHYDIRGGHLAPSTHPESGSRSDTPRSRSGSVAGNGPLDRPPVSRDREREHDRPYEHEYERARPSMTHAMHPAGEADADRERERERPQGDFHRNGAALGRGLPGPSEARKRSRSEMEGDVDMDSAPGREER
ncbi:hypothetical protein DENSPDRAFT_43649 [Dentipellis sp. KUC8613]|nr:hypothetical protein DENSPDRAFT_43649 [Dentipellis sp. KUC8613]